MKRRDGKTSLLDAAEQPATDRTEPAAAAQDPSTLQVEVRVGPGSESLTESEWSAFMGLPASEPRARDAAGAPHLPRPTRH
jgi:hypothetical protein